MIPTPWVASPTVAERRGERRYGIIESTMPTTGDAPLRRELGLPDLVLAQVLCVVGSSWVGVAAKLGAAHIAFWLGAIALYYLPLAAVVIHLNRRLPVEGGLYQWAKLGFGPRAGFLIAWNLWVYAVICTGAIVFTVPTDIAYMAGPAAAWIPASKPATLAITGAVVAAIAAVAVRGLGAGKWLHNAGGVMILLAYAILLPLPLWALAHHRLAAYHPFAWRTPPVSWYSLAVFGQMTTGALSGFEYVAILAGEARDPARNIGRSVMISAPVIAGMFILGTSSVLAFSGGRPIDLIGPIPQTFRRAFGDAGPAALLAPLFIVLLAARSISSASLLFTGLTRLPMTAGWDHAVPAWFARLDPRTRTPVNSILFVAVLVMALIVASMLGVREQEANQTLTAASIVHYSIAYIALFALPLAGAARLREGLPAWLKAAAALGLGASAIAFAVALYPIVDVVSRAAFAAKIAATVVAANALGMVIYRSGRPAAREGKSQPAAADLGSHR